VLRHGEGAGIWVPTTLVPLSIASWASNRFMPVTITSLLPEVFNLGGVLGLGPGGTTLRVGDAT